MRPITTSKQRSCYGEGLCFQPMAQTFDFSKEPAERQLIASYKEQLGKSKNHKFKTILKVS